MSINNKLFSHEADKRQFYFFNIVGGILIPLILIIPSIQASVEPVTWMEFSIVHSIIFLIFTYLMYTRNGKTIFSNSNENQRTPPGRSGILTFVFFTIDGIWIFIIYMSYLADLLKDKAV